MKEIIKLVDISKKYQNTEGNVTALKNVTFCIEQGSMNAIIGRSGSGKSTLMNLMGLLDKPTSGSYYLDDTNVKDLNDRQLSVLRSKKIGYVFQGFHLIPRLTALENVCIPLLFQGFSPEEQKRRAYAAIETVGLSDRINHLPSQLSGGQQQRIAIARATVTDPEILLADEPTGNLDPESGQKILSLLSQFRCRGTTVILITHDLKLASVADRIFNLSAGVITQMK